MYSLEGSRKKTPITENSSEKMGNYKKANAFNNFTANVNKTQQRQQTRDKILLSRTLTSKTGEPMTANFNDPCGPHELPFAIYKLSNN